MLSNFFHAPLLLFICYFFLGGCLAELNISFNDLVNTLPDGVVQIIGTKDVVPRFQPININAAVGQIVSFRFFANTTSNFTVTEGTFEAPCVPKPGGFNSGNITNFWNPKNPDFYFFNFTIFSNAPFYYFSTEKKCTSGMAGGINTPSNTSAIFRQKSMILASTSPNSTIPSSPSSTQNTTSPRAVGSNVGLVLIAVSLGLAGIMFSVFAILTYVKRRRRAREASDLESEKISCKGDKFVGLELDGKEQPAELGLKSPGLFELMAENGLRHLSGIRPSRRGEVGPDVTRKEERAVQSL